MTIELEPQVFEACLEQLGTSLTAVAETERGHADTLPRGTQHIGQEMLVRFSIRAAGFGSAVDRQLPPEGMEGEALTRWLADELNRVLREVQRTATPKAMVEILRAMHQLVVRRGNRMEVPVPPLALDEVGVSTRRVVVRRSTTPARPVAVPPAPAQPHAPAVADESVAPPTRESPRPPARREETIETLMGKVEAEIKTLLQSLQGVPMDHLLVVPSRVMSDHFSATVAALRVAECYGGKFEKAQAAAQTYASSIDDLVKQLPSARAKHQFRLAVAAMERKAFSAPVCYLAVESGGKEHLTKQTAIKLDQIRRGIEQFRRRGEEANALVLILGMAGRAAWGEGDSPSPVLNLAKLDALKKEVAEAVAENQDMEVADILAAIDALPGYLDDQDGLVHGRQLLQRIH
ncbi:MAG TPA: hypothetical protein PKL83_03685, partial [bacterium]|nr:hypothetical protein [bacterium]